MAAVTVLGSGMWGLSLAIQLAGLEHEVTLWARKPDFAAELSRTRENVVYLPGAKFPPSLRVAGSLDQACDGATLLLFVCPSSGIRSLAEAVRPLLSGQPTLVNAAKGVEYEARMTMSAILEDVLGDRHRARVGVLSGPSFAREVAVEVPTAVTAAAHDPAVAETIQRLLSGPTFRVYTTTDVVGVEIGGAVKNVIALAAGVSDGLGFGHNSRAALITRGVAELTRLATRLGAPSGRRAPDGLGAFWRRGPDPHLYGGSIAQPTRRTAPRPGGAAGGHHGQHEGSCRGSAQHTLRARPGAERVGRDADHRGD